jgi:hypothetical protein
MGWIMSQQTASTSESTGQHAGGQPEKQLDARSAVTIYLAKPPRPSTSSQRKATASALATEYNTTTKAVRDIWRLRTWLFSTMPHWTERDTKKFLSRNLCETCRRAGVTSLTEACARCRRMRSRT